MLWRPRSNAHPATLAPSRPGSSWAAREVPRSGRRSREESSIRDRDGRHDKSAVEPVIALFTARRRDQQAAVAGGAEEMHLVVFSARIMLGTDWIVRTQPGFF